MGLNVKHWIKVYVGSQVFPVRLGDTVWFYPGCNMDTTPQVGVITLIGEDNMVDLQLVNHSPGGMTRKSGVCLFGGDKLANPVYRNKGCWMPRYSDKTLLDAASDEG